MRCPGRCELQRFWVVTQDCFEFFLGLQVLPFCQELETCFVTGFPRFCTLCVDAEASAQKNKRKGLRASGDWKVQQELQSTRLADPGCIIDSTGLATHE